MDTESSVVQIKTEDIYADSAKYVEARFDTSNLAVKKTMN